MKTKIIIIDDHPFMREGIVAYLSKESDLDMVGEAESGKAAIQLVHDLNPDIVLLDLMLTDMPGERVLKQINKSHPLTKTIVLSNYSDSTHIKIAIAAGAFGYLVKTDPPELVIKAIRNAIMGKKTFTKSVKDKFSGPDEIEYLGESWQPLLTHREIEILGLLACGLSNREIAEKCCISESTVRTHIHHLKEKKGIDSRQKLAVYALREGFN